MSMSEISRRRIAKWIESAKPLDEVPVWTETRQAIDFGDHTYIIQNGQIFQCAHCGTFDPEWNATEVLAYFRENFGIKPYTIEVVCSVAAVKQVK
jgi:hypothetical protein